jgi:hypothetical protein
MERLERIEVLERQGADARAVLAEVRELLREGEAWLAAEGAGAEAAAGVLGACRRAYDAEAVPAA